MITTNASADDPSTLGGLTCHYLHTSTPFQLHIPTFEIYSLFIFPDSLNIFPDSLNNSLNIFLVVYFFSIQRRRLPSWTTLLPAIFKMRGNLCACLVLTALAVTVHAGEPTPPIKWCIIGDEAIELAFPNYRHRIRDSLHWRWLHGRFHHVYRHALP